MPKALTNFRLCERGRAALVAAWRLVRFCVRYPHARQWLVSLGLRGVAYVGWPSVIVVSGGAFLKSICFNFEIGQTT
jgi:hypothetical protein